MKNNTDILDNARDLGNSIIKSQQYNDLLKSEEDYYNDKELTRLLKKLEDYKKGSKEKGHIAKIQEKINQNKSMISYRNAKDKYDEVFKNINNLITYITDGQSRPIMEVGTVKKDCSSCSGCKGGCGK